MSKKPGVTIEVYDEGGVMCESIGGPMNYEDIRATMISILKNDGIPVIRQHANAKRAEQQPAKTWEQPMAVHITYGDVKYSVTGKYEDVMDAQNEFLKSIIVE